MSFDEPFRLDPGAYSAWQSSVDFDGSSGSGGGSVPLPRARPSDAPGGSGGGWGSNFGPTLDWLKGTGSGSGIKAPSIGDVLGGMAGGPGGAGGGWQAWVDAWLIRAFIVILGFIFIAAGLSMFGRGTVVESVRNAVR